MSATETFTCHTAKERQVPLVTPIEHAAGSKVNFGAIVTGIDLNNLDLETISFIQDALYRHKFLVFEGQPRMLTPENQFRLTYSFDPKSDGRFAHGSDPLLCRFDNVDIYGTQRRVALPQQHQVHVLGRGRVGQNPYMLPPELEIESVDHAEPHATVLSPEQRENGESRFYQWHFDGALYDVPPPIVGCLLAVHTPKGSDVRIAWDNRGEQHAISVAPGSTAMFSGAQAYELLSDAEKEMALNSKVEYAPHTFQWISTAHFTDDGMSIVSEGKEMKAEDMPPVRPEAVKTYPMVWTNPVTGEKSLQIHCQGVRRLLIKKDAHDSVRVVEDLAEARSIAYELMSRALRPEYIYAHHHKESDVILWYNRGLMHSITEFPPSRGKRIMHQCNVSASYDPQ